jgi:hypothetical protein
MATITSLNFAPEHLGHQDERYYTDQDRAENWAPANVWSWLWPGKAMQLVTVEVGAIVTATDVSGNGRNWDAFDGTSGLRARESLDYPEEDWATDLPVLQGVRNAVAGVNRLLSPLNATGEFYLGHAIWNARGAGSRYMFGGDTANNYAVLRQADKNVRMVIDGSAETQLADDGLVVGDEVWMPFFLEIFRDSSDVVHCWVNMVDVGNKPTLAGTFPVSQFGGHPDWSGGGRWDDFMAELFISSAVPTLQQRREIYNYFRVKWQF